MVVAFCFGASSLNYNFKKGWQDQEHFFMNKILSRKVGSETESIDHILVFHWEAPFIGKKLHFLYSSETRTQDTGSLRQLC